MIHYHGTPITPEHAAARILDGRHAFVSFANPQQLPLVADLCQSFALDNGAFSAWRSGEAITDWEPFYAWVRQWHRHPGFDWFLIPDVIDGDEDDNAEFVAGVPEDLIHCAVPVWHLHESLDRLESLAFHWKRIAFGSSGEFAALQTDRWWRRMDEAMSVICDGGRPCTRIHGLRMLDPQIFSVFPFTSADSTNVARNINLDTRWRGTYAPPSEAVRGENIVSRIEFQQSAPEWIPRNRTGQLFELQEPTHA